MPWIEGDDARGYSPFMRAQGANPRVREAHLALYGAIMEAESPLSRAEREAIAVAVSEANQSDY